MSVLKKVTRKARVTKDIFREQGALGVTIRSLQFIQKKTNRTPSRLHKINSGAHYDEVLATDLSKDANISWKGTKKPGDRLTINWLMPPPGKGSGGHMTLFRFIRYLELAGHTCQIYFFNPHEKSTVEAVRTIMGDDFPEVRANMQWLKKGEQMAEADAVFATSWQTAYSVRTANINAKKFYFVQDFEPYFYPVGGMYTLAENTYRMGLRGITAGGWLKKKLHDDYGMVTDAFPFGSDSSTYRFDNSAPRKEVVFYARPTTERRAFELGIMALDLFHANHPDYVINLIGWDVSDIKIPFPYKNLGILSPEELNATYNRCAASLVMSMTNMSLLPLELLGSGCIPVVTDGANNRLVSDNKYIAYTMSDPLSLANMLGEVVTRKDLPIYAQKASRSVIKNDWDDAGKVVVSIVEESVATDGGQ